MFLLSTYLKRKRMKIKSREDLKNYVLKRLGSPVIRINVEESQLQDRLDDALEFYQTFSDDAQKKTIVKRIVTQEDIDREAILLGDQTLAVTRVFPTEAFSSPEYQNFIRELKDLQAGALDSYFITERNIALLNFLMGKESISFTFYPNTLSLGLNTNWRNFIPGTSFILYEGTEKIDPVLYPNLWGSYWLRELAYFLVLRQWASNLKKYSGVQLPGGITLNASEMLSEAETNLANLQTQMAAQSDPLPFFEIA